MTSFTMASTTTKNATFKGQSRIFKRCHWCAKDQDPKQKPFQACGRCKEVIYCSKACQVASWPFHKVPCKTTTSMKKTLDAQGPAVTTPIANFKKWHCLHYHTLRHAAICALNLGFNPKAVNDGMVLIEVDLKLDHETLPIKRRYMPISGCVGTYEESRIFFTGPKGDEILESLRECNHDMQQRGSAGAAAVILYYSRKIVDLVRISLLSPEATRMAQESDNWGDDWLRRLQHAIETD